MNFEEALDYLLSLGHETLAIKLGLRNTELLLDSLGNPHKSFQSVQIAGTNGKGSTAAVLASICSAAGIKAGLFTSPHLISITERIVIDGHEISKNEFAKHSTDVRLAAEELLNKGRLPALPTFFEHVTAIALQAFKEANVKMAILETGLGGRLDATTVAAAQTVAITPLAIDHQEYLGETLEEIASEKAAIIRPGTAAIVACQPQIALDVILRRCREFNITPELVNEGQATIQSTTGDGRFNVTINSGKGSYEGVQLGLRGHHQIMNTLVAVVLAESLQKRGIHIPDTAIVKGIETAKHPGRLELYEGAPSLLLDGAHNPSGAEALKRYLDEFVSGPITLIFGAMKDKKLEEIAGILFPLAERLIVTRIRNPRSRGVDKLIGLASGYLPEEKIVAALSATEALAIAREETPSNGLICVTGSLYLVGAIKQIIDDRGMKYEP